MTMKQSMAQIKLDFVKKPLPTFRIRIVTMQQSTPQVADIYSVYVQAFGIPDQKPRPRLHAIVLANKATLGLIGRESAKYGKWKPSAPYLISPITPAYSFDKEGYWMGKNYKTVLLASALRKPKSFKYRATLTDPELSKLANFVDTNRKAFRL
jgi:hypothetical protein